MKQLEDDPSQKRLDSIKNRDIENVGICRIIVEETSGKQNPKKE
jgi:hypothetical protein